jgi:predicted enzyme related to lactoylglutathione lyase
MITAAGIRAAVARLTASGERPTVQSVASELHVKAIELEPLLHQMFRDGQLDPSVDTIHEPESPAGPGKVASTGAPDAEGVDPSLSRAGGVSYLHIPAVDPEQSAVFYERVFGWTVDGHDTNRPSFRDGTGHVAGAWVTDQEPSRTAGLLPYIYVDTIDVTTELIRAHGGEVVGTPTVREDLLIATFRDPAGNVLGLWQEVAPPPATSPDSAADHF